MNEELGRPSGPDYSADGVFQKDIRAGKARDELPRWRP